ncbi:hypothetical protein BDV18DRAFT_95397 [Aspergillus unguis]
MLGAGGGGEGEYAFRRILTASGSHERENKEIISFHFSRVTGMISQKSKWRSPSRSCQASRVGHGGVVLRLNGALDASWIRLVTCSGPLSRPSPVVSSSPVLHFVRCLFVVLIQGPVTRVVSSQPDCFGLRYFAQLIPMGCGSCIALLHPRWARLARGPMIPLVLAALRLLPFIYTARDFQTFLKPLYPVYPDSCNTHPLASP